MIPLPQFIVLHEHEGVPIMETLTQRLGKFSFLCCGKMLPENIQPYFSVF